MSDGDGETLIKDVLETVSAEFCLVSFFFFLNIPQNNSQEALLTTRHIFPAFPCSIIHPLLLFNLLRADSEPRIHLPVPPLRSRLQH